MATNRIHHRPARSLPLATALILAVSAWIAAVVASVVFGSVIPDKQLPIMSVAYYLSSLLAGLLLLWLWRAWAPSAAAGRQLLRATALGMSGSCLFVACASLMMLGGLWAEPGVEFGALDETWPWLVVAALVAGGHAGLLPTLLCWMAACVPLVGRLDLWCGRRHPSTPAPSPARRWPLAVGVVLGPLAVAAIYWLAGLPPLADHALLRHP